jgi:hypothetical protein
LFRPLAGTVIHFDDGDVQDLDLNIIKWNSLEAKAKAKKPKVEQKPKVEKAEVEMDFEPKTIIC